MSELEQRKNDLGASRSRLMARIDQLRARTKPQALLDDAKAAAGKGAVTLATGLITQRKARPAIALGAITAGLAYLFRKPLLNALAKRLAPETDNDK